MLVCQASAFAVGLPNARGSCDWRAVSLQSPPVAQPARCTMDSASLTDQQYIGQTRMQAEHAELERERGREQWDSPLRRSAALLCSASSACADHHGLRAHLTDALSIIAQAPAKVKPIEFLAQ